MMTRVASFARDTPVALLTKGTVLEPLGFTSRIKTVPPLTAYWIFISPTTFSSRARALVCVLIFSMTPEANEMAGRTQALSPLWIPASSICSMIPATTVSVPSEMASTSISVAASRKLSMRIGLPGET